MKNLTTLYREALQLINLARQAMGLPWMRDFVPGRPCSWDRDTIAMTLRSGLPSGAHFLVGLGSIEFPTREAACAVGRAWNCGLVACKDSRQVIMPGVLSVFCSEFDLEHYPRLIACPDPPRPLALENLKIEGRPFSLPL